MGIVHLNLLYYNLAGLRFKMLRSKGVIKLSARARQVDCQQTGVASPSDLRNHCQCKTLLVKHHQYLRNY